MASASSVTFSDTAVVLGLNPNGLGIVRSLSAVGIPVIGVDRTPTGIWDTNIWMSSRTRLCRKVFYDPENSNLLERLLELGKTLSTRGILFPSGDDELLCISRYRDELEKYFKFRIPDSKTVELIANKDQFSAFARQQNIPAPVTLAGCQPDEVGMHATSLEFPCLIKPSLRDKKWNIEFNDQKVLIANSATELEELFHRAYQFNKQLLIQEIIPGADSNLYFSHVYLSENLETLAIWTGRKIRQRPIHFGTSTMTESIWNDQIASSSLKLLKSLNCSGYSSVEYKRDPRDGLFKIMEVTQGRTWYPHYLGFGAGVNIPYVWYRDLAGLEAIASPDAKDHVRWIDECRDPVASYDYWRNGELTFWNWMVSYKRVSIFAFASLRDPLPFFCVVARFAAEFGRFVYRNTLGRLVAQRHQ